MAHIPIHKKLGRKRAIKERRKHAVATMQRYRAMADAFLQLSPIDEFRIRNRVYKEIQRPDDCQLPGLNILLKRLNRAHIYTLELLETVVV